MRIDEPEEAIKAFGTARKESPRDAAVANQVGQALVVTHEYKKAVEHYEDSLVTVKGGPARLELLYNFGGSIFTNYSLVVMFLLPCLGKLNIFFAEPDTFSFKRCSYHSLTTLTLFLQVEWFWNPTHMV